MASRFVNKKLASTEWLMAAGFKSDGDALVSPGYRGYRVTTRNGKWSVENCDGNYQFIPIPFPPRTRTAVRDLCKMFGIHLATKPEMAAD